MRIRIGEDVATSAASSSEPLRRLHRGIKEESFMSNIRIRTAVAFVAAAFAFAAAPLAQAQSPVVLKAVSGWDKSLVFVDKYMDWIKRVNEKGAGKVRIDYIGGPEVFPSFEQLEPLKRCLTTGPIPSTPPGAWCSRRTPARWRSRRC